MHDTHAPTNLQATIVKNVHPLHDAASAPAGYAEIVRLPRFIALVSTVPGTRAQHPILVLHLHPIPRALLVLHKVLVQCH